MFKAKAIDVIITFLERERLTFLKFFLVNTLFGAALQLFNGFKHVITYS